MIKNMLFGFIFGNTCLGFLIGLWNHYNDYIYFPLLLAGTGLSIVLGIVVWYEYEERK